MQPASKLIAMDIKHARPPWKVINILYTVKCLRAFYFRDFRDQGHLANIKRRQYKFSSMCCVCGGGKRKQ
jgi:hypothetical protein